MNSGTGCTKTLSITQFVMCLTLSSSVTHCGLYCFYAENQLKATSLLKTCVVQDVEEIKIKI